MPDLDGLPPDQRAALLLLLRQRQSYRQLSETLHIEEDAVRRRAHAALEALGPPGGQRLTDERRTEIADYLLGQQTSAEREATGAHLRAGAAIVVAVVLVIVLSGGGGGGKKSARATTPTNTTTTTTQGANRPVAQINLFSPRGGTKTVALAQIFRNGSQRAIVIAAQGLSPGTYALWLYNSASSAKLLGFVPARVTSSGKFATQGALPAD